MTMDPRLGAPAAVGPTVARLRALGVDVTVSGPLPIPHALFDEWCLEPPTGLACAVRVRESNEVDWTTAGNDLEVALPTAEFNQAPNVVYPGVMFAVERVRQAAGHFLLHAAAVADDHGALVVLGDSGAGKTATAAALAAAGLRFVSGDNTPIRLEGERLCTHGHATSIRLRASTVAHLARRLPERDSWIPIDLATWAVKSRRPWDDKRIVSPDLLGFALSSGSIPVKTFADIRLIEGSAVSWERVPAISLMLRISKMLALPLSGSWALFDNVGRLRALPMVASEERLAMTRFAAISSAAAVPAFRVRGDLEEVAVLLEGWLRSGPPSG